MTCFYPRPYPKPTRPQARPSGIPVSIKRMIAPQTVETTVFRRRLCLCAGFGQNAAPESAGRGRATPRPFGPLWPESSQDHAGASSRRGFHARTGRARRVFMWYFAYGSNLNSRAVVDWSRHFGHRPPPMKPGKPAVLDNYRLCFPIFSEYWGGGIADIVYDPGKYVAGAVFDLTEQDLAILDQKVGRRVDPGGKELGIVKRIEVEVAP